MRVIFLQDVPNIARAGEVKEVSSGYARNFLVPKKLAMMASSSAVSLAEVQHKINVRIQQQTEAEIAELAGQLEGRDVFLSAKVGTKDRLYGSITNADIAAELKKSAGLVIDKKKIELDKPINQLGSYEVPIRLAKDVIPKVKVTVTGEEAD
ncbi:50S ribosomal protein L9 [Chloroflexota bacterium]